MSGTRSERRAAHEAVVGAKRCWEAAVTAHRAARAAWSRQGGDADPRAWVVMERAWEERRRARRAYDQSLSRYQAICHPKPKPPSP